MKRIYGSMVQLTRAGGWAGSHYSTVQDFGCHAPCRHCTLPLIEHVYPTGECLFEPTDYAPPEGSPKKIMEMLRNCKITPGELADSPGW